MCDPAIIFRPCGNGRIEATLPHSPGAVVRDDPVGRDPAAVVEQRRRPVGRGVSRSGAGGPLAREAGVGAEGVRGSVGEEVVLVGGARLARVHDRVVGVGVRGATHDLDGAEAFAFAPPPPTDRLVGRLTDRLKRRLADRPTERLCPLSRRLSQRLPELHRLQELRRTSSRGFPFDVSWPPSNCPRHCGNRDIGVKCTASAEAQRCPRRASVHGGGRKHRDYGRGDGPGRDAPVGPAAAERVVALAGEYGSVALVGQHRARALVRQQ